MYVSGPSQKTPEWYQERAVRLTGSNWYNILKDKEKPSGLIGRRHGSKFSEMCKAYGDRYEKASLRSVQTFLNPYNMQFILMLIMSIIRISCIKLSHTEFWFVMFYKSKIQAMISTGN